MRKITQLPLWWRGKRGRGSFHGQLRGVCAADMASSWGWMSLVPVTSYGRTSLLWEEAWPGELSWGIHLPPLLCCPSSLGALTTLWPDDVRPPTPWWRPGCGITSCSPSLSLGTHCNREQTGCRGEVEVEGWKSSAVYGETGLECLWGPPKGGTRVFCEMRKGAVGGEGWAKVCVPWLQSRCAWDGVKILPGNGEQGHRVTDGNGSAIYSNFFLLHVSFPRREHSVYSQGKARASSAARCNCIFLHNCPRGWAKALLRLSLSSQCIIENWCKIQLKGHSGVSAAAA